jgi:acyl-CoA reductase-like NAD-dependent aldehyde dehydrogenase
MAVAEETRPQAKAELRRARMLIGGAWVDSMSRRVLTVENPAKRQPIAEIPRGDTADVNGAVEAAARAFPAWSKVAPRDRGRLLLRIAEAMEARAEGVARTIALEPATRCAPRLAAKRGSAPTSSAISAASPAS